MANLSAPNRYETAFRAGFDKAQAKATNPESRAIAAIEKRQDENETVLLTAITKIARRLDKLEKKARGPNAADLSFMAATSDDPAAGVALKQRAAVAKALEGRA